MTQFGHDPLDYFWAVWLLGCALLGVLWLVVRAFRRWPRATMAVLSGVIVFVIGLYFLATGGFLMLLRALGGM